MSCRAPGQERFTRLKNLGADYTEEAIRERIAGRRTKAAKAPREQRGVSLLIDIENSIKAAQSKGYEQWAKIHNLKQAAKTMNFLTEHKIEQYADLVSRIEKMAAESGQAADALKNAEKRLADMAVLIKNVSTYQKKKPAYDACCKKPLFLDDKKFCYHVKGELPLGKVNKVQNLIWLCNDCYRMVNNDPIPPDIDEKVLKKIQKYKNM